MFGGNALPMSVPPRPENLPRLSGRVGLSERAPRPVRHAGGEELREDGARLEPWRPLHGEVAVSEAAHGTGARDGRRYSDSWTG